MHLASTMSVAGRMVFFFLDLSVFPLSSRIRHSSQVNRTPGANRPAGFTHLSRTSGTDTTLFLHNRIRQGIEHNYPACHEPSISGNSICLPDGNFRFCGSRPPQKVVRIPPILQTASVRCRFICAPSGFSDSDTRILSLAHVIYTNGTHSCVAVMQFAESTTNC